MKTNNTSSGFTVARWLALVLVVLPGIQALASTVPAFKITTSTRAVGQKVYESNNQVQSVAVTYSDKKRATHSGSALQQPEVVIESWQDLYAFGGETHGRSMASNTYRYGYQGSEKDDEHAGDGNSYTTFFRQLDPRVGRWMSIDPKATARESPYASMGNNPIINTDVLGDTIRGNDKNSGKRIVKTIQNSFQGEDAADLRALFKLEADGVTLSPIGEDDFAQAVALLDADNQALAYSYYTVVNSADLSVVQMLTMTESIDADVHAALAGITGATMHGTIGPGFNYLKDGVSYSVVLMGASLPTPDMRNSSSTTEYSMNSTDGGVFAHEVLGHGAHGLLGSAQADFENAIQMGNLYRRAMGLGYWRTGTSHESPAVTLAPATAQAVPPLAVIPAAMKAKISSYVPCKTAEKEALKIQAAQRAKEQQHRQLMDDLMRSQRPVQDRFDPLRVR